MDEARCREVGGEIFFPENGENSANARAVCAACPVRAACLDHALALEASSVWTVSGIWGGTSEKERRGLRRLAA